MISKFKCFIVCTGLVLVGGFLSAAHADISVLYAPSNPDNAAFRSELAALVGGPVDYLNAYTSPTPTLDFLLRYDCVFTWANYPYYDRLAFGDVLADYVDAGGRVILGQWAYSGLVGWPWGGEFYGRILYREYCPVAYISTSFGSGTYAADGSDCVNLGVGGYQTSYLDVIAALQPGALCDGSFTLNDSPAVGWRDPAAVAWRADRRVYYSPGNTGGSYGTGDWARLTANMCTCPAPLVAGDLNCDGTINAFDIDPFVLALTDPAAYAAEFSSCDYMLADCNDDGAVNAFDIDPFVALLVGSP
jgi:hypothetical protein